MESKKKKKSVAAERIRKAFERSNEIEVEVIPATKKRTDDPNRVLRVCAYCRVSTLEESQDASYELQRLEYKEMIESHENWEFQGVYGDKESGTSVMHRSDFLKMIDACREGKVDLIITKSISRFARNVLDCLYYVRELKKMNPPIGIYFETEHINTLDPASDMVLHVLSVVAQEESAQKSKSIKWAYRKRFERGIPMTNMWAILGYGNDENGNIIIIEEEAEIIRFIFRSYIEGKTSSEIADALTVGNVPTPKGKDRWLPGTINGMLHNEKYCGDMVMQKTVSVDLYSHKVVKNDGIEDQYRLKDYHPPIVSRQVFDKVQEIFRNGGNRRRREKYATKKVKLKPIKKGSLQGYVPLPVDAESIDIEQLTAKFKIKK